MQEEVPKEKIQLDPRLKKEVERHPYPLLFATVSGAHLYGFPSPDSDLTCLYKKLYLH
jgi:hypothetical protein